MIDLAMDMEQYDCPFIDTTTDHDVEFAAAHWEFHPVAEELECRMVVEAADRGALDNGLSALQTHDNMHEVDLLAKRDDVAHLKTVMGETEAMGTIRGNDGYITGPFYIADGSETWHVGFDQASKADGTLSELEKDNEFDVVERDEVTLPQMNDVVQNAAAAMTLVDGCRDLSDVERQTLESAASGGYFESPRQTNLGDLAEEFDVSKPAVSKNLRRGERKMVERVVDALSELDD
ncbi:helix-turn-helix domain-containing protein [Halorubellus sp. JP-L1]|uniref:helix-turn-helix domain-containing protein n=1 Tax=Halorubellus sp. JP-L1 TaxID=2715753 RepID=UPI0014084587|nr:helix-turn-helix domain-containing protein [Halorubellus sp. JP-L1]NHN43418.1 helix-turn-helix domain-containing protein [Halorubellus sp. JP-L1]